MNKPVDKLASLTARFSTAPEPTRFALREMRDEDPLSFARLAILQLGLEPNGPASAVLALLLSRDELYLRFLADPAELTNQQAANAARVMASRDKRFYVKLTDYADDSLSSDGLSRVMQIAEALGAAGLLVPWLRRMTRHPDKYIRQKAVMIMCQAGSNPLLVERQLQSADPRVRANAVESLWTVNTPSARSLLEFATQDPHHRVALNALVGLFMQGETSAFERINALTGHHSPAFRIAAAWALGLTGKAEAWPALTALRDDPEELVRESALRALEKVPEPPTAPENVLERSREPAPAPIEPEQAERPAYKTPQFRLVP